ncbi:spore germination protein [Paenibacillus glucanolyticus]|uniref:spore germination protein n=1 Tax=Paenibacillus glucanolyticus TaxID=59843 RepID=UPI00367CAAC6
MQGWHKIKKYLVADLSQTQNPNAPFALRPLKNDEDAGLLNGQEPASMPQIKPLLGDNGPLAMTSTLEQNINWLKGHFSYPQNSGLVFRPFVIEQTGAVVQGMIVHLESQVDSQHLNQFVIHPLINAKLTEDQPLSVDTLKTHIVTDCHLTSTSYFGEIVHEILNSSAAILIDGLDTAILADVKGGEKRGLESPKTENVVRGPQVGFTEDMQTNLSLLRGRLSTSDLIVESGVVGTVSQTAVSIVYLKSITNAELVNEVRRRIAAVRIDYIGDSGMLEQLIEDKPYSIYPGMLSTERPDHTAAQIADGYVAILVNNSPFALIVPTQFPLFLQTAEDRYLRWQYSSFLRIIRAIGFLMSLYLPAVYVAIANFHHEMIPTTLVLAIAGTRESIPLPVAAEAFLLESMFELIREAGVRIPSVIGPTIGIVGALILGQAAVQANIVSPIMVIVTAATALASYTIPNYNMQFTTRILRFVYLAFASFMGLIGIVLLSIILWTSWMSVNRFGVPSLAPLTPHPKNENTLLRGPLQKPLARPFSVRPQRSKKKPNGQDGAPEQGGEN